MQSDQRKQDGAGSVNDISLTKLLQLADLSSYEIRLRGDLKLRNAEDLQYVEEVDLSGIGMSRPEQKRLRKEYDKMYPKGVVGKLKKVFGKSDAEKKDNNTVELKEDQHIIAIEKITLCKELGRGEFGSVWNASWKSSGSGEILQVAVKCVDPDKLIATSSSFLQEASIMTKMRHDNIVCLYGVVLDTKRVMMVSELATCGSLLECLHKPALKDSFPIHVLCDYAEQICKGMAYLESKKLIHRDLASRNVLVFSPKKVKISDFGLSRSLGIGEDYYRTEFSPNLRLPIAWCAPECINYLKFTSASDVWAFGITLYEIFSYGQMPWNGMNGAEILDAIDRQRRVLPQPDCCPEDIYETMKECWAHNPRQRPTFAELVVQFPEKQPQIVRAVCDIKDAAADHLSFKKDDLITVIQKTPSSYPDGYYWFGSLRNGRTGLFRPADTVAHLGAENPSDYINKSCVPNESKKDKKNSKKSKEEERERKKALISEPVGDLRHTCHVGIDGYAFGLLQLDKKEMTVPVASPEGRRSLGNKSQSSVNATSSAVPLRSDLGREGVSLRDTMSLREPSGAVSPSTSRHQPVKPVRTSLQPSAPPLTSSAESTMTKNMRDVFEELNSSLRSLEMSASSTTPLFQESTRSRGDFKKPQPICAVYARSPTNGHRSPPNASDIILTTEVEHLERDLTEFSLSSMSERPLLKKEKPEKAPPPSRVIHTGSSLRSMTSDEHEKWQSKQSREHKKAENLLSEEKRSASSTEELDKSLMSTLREKQNEPVEWSPEAQEAYKLLVECGTTLQQTNSPSASRASTIDKKEKRVTIIENKTITPPPRPLTPPHEENVTSYTPQKRIHIIETKLLSGPADDARNNGSGAPNLPPKGAIDTKPPTLPPKVRQVPIAVDGRMNYDNLNGFGAGKNPPPVPPKPKVNIQRPSISPPPNTIMEEKDSPGIAEAITRTALFTNQNKEEVVKF